LSNFAPNLSQMAVNFSEYEVHQLVFELRPVISENNVNNGQSGIGMLVFDYDNSDYQYDGKEEVMNNFGSASGRITETIKCGVECDPAQSRRTEFKIRTSPIRSGQTIDEYDKGILTIATNNIPSEFSNQQIFELWVYYTVDLRKRKAGALKVANQQTDLFAIANIVDMPYSADLLDFGSKLLYKDSILSNLAVGQQNNIGGTWDSPYPGGDPAGQLNVLVGSSNTFSNRIGSTLSSPPLTYNAGTPDLFYVFPPNASGLFHIRMKMIFTPATGTVASPTGGAFPYTFPLIFGVWGKGNVVGVKDILSGTNASINSASAINLYSKQTIPAVSASAGPPAVVATPAVPGFFYAEAHVKVTSATGGQNNIVLFQFGISNLAGMEITSCSWEVAEMTQKGFVSNSNFTPQYINNDGVVITPA